MSANQTDFEPPTYDTCDDVSDRCPVSATIYGDYFTTGACAFFAAMYGLLLIAQGYLGWRSKTWSFMSWLAAGTVFEFAGYIGRAMLSKNPWQFTPFILQNLSLVLGPTFVAASISITFKYIVMWYGTEWSLIRPSLYPWVFVGTDLISIVIQGTGGGVSSVASNREDGQSLMDVGNGLLIAGVCFQVVNMTFCGGLMLVYIWRRRQALRQGQASISAEGVGSSGDETPTQTASRFSSQKAGSRQDSKVKMFIWALTGAYIAIIIRCIYRIPEMSMGWGSSLMKNETTFLILDGAMILIAVLLLTVFHPCYFFPFLGHRSEVTEEEVSETHLHAESYEMRSVT